ncbi:MAG: hypothetical protein ABEI80_03845 [Haloplanus sp.]
MALPSLSTTFGAAMLVVGLLVVAVSARHVWRTSAVLRADATERIEGVADGTLVRVSGTVEAADTVTAPFSGAACVALRTVVEERRPGALLLPTYVTIHEPTESVPFDVRTPHAAVSVAAPFRTVALASTVVATVGPGDDPPPRIDAYERRADDLPRETVFRSPPAILAPITRALSLGTRRYSERRASPGDAVTVVGRVEGGRVDPLVVSDAAPRRTLVRLSKTSLAGLLVGGFGLLLGVALLLGG